MFLGFAHKKNQGLPENQLSKEQVLERLLAAHTAWFDVTRNYTFAGRQFAGYAEFHTHGEKYVLTKRAKLWEADSHEYLFFHVASHLDSEQLRDLIAFMKRDALTKVEPKPNHMSSALSLIVIADSLSEEACKLARSTRFRRSFLLGVRGWADLRIALVEVPTNKVITNSAGVALRDTVRANLIV